MPGNRFRFVRREMRGDGYGNIEMDCNSLECIHGDFHSLVFPGDDLEKR